MTSTAALARQAGEAGQGFALSGEQAAVVLRLVTSDRMLDAVLGPPGTGKTTLLRAARTAWEAEGYAVAGAATAAVAAQNLALESGIGSRTVAQWVHRIRAGEGLSGVDVLVLDEANLTDDRDRAALYQAAGRSGTKLVEVGDPQQLRGVGCGSLFARVHQLVGGMELTENRRQASEDERAAIAAWRDGRYTQALSSWAGRGRLVATETGEQAVTAMVASWMGQRAGAPDAHAEMRGVVMLAAANDTVERLNDAAQAVRAAAGELGPERLFEVKGGRSLRLRAGDHVLVRLNDRAQRMHEGPDVLNGYRGIVEHIDSRPGSSGADGAVRVAWQQHGPDGPVTHRATLSAEFVGAGGLSLGYAMTGHKAEGLTVTADWALPGGTRQGGTVLVHAAGMDEPGLHVATSRHRDKVILFAGRDQLETPGDTHELGIPTTGQQLERRVVAALAEQARTRPGTANDTPVHDDLGRGAGRAPDRTPGRGADLDPLPRAVEQSDLADAWAELKAQALAEDQPLVELRKAWSEQARAAEQLAALEPRLAAARADAARERRAEQVLAPLRDQLETARTAQHAAEQAAGPAEQALAGRAGQIAAELSQAWEQQRPAARAAANRVQAGPGRLGIRRGQVRAAQAQLDGWANTWRPVLGPSRLAADQVMWFAAAHPANDQVQQPIAGYAQAQAQLPEQTRLLGAADQARRDADTAAAAYTQASNAARHRLNVQRRPRLPAPGRGREPPRRADPGRPGSPGHSQRTDRRLRRRPRDHQQARSGKLPGPHPRRLGPRGPGRCPYPASRPAASRPAASRPERGPPGTRPQRPQPAARPAPRSPHVTQAPDTASASLTGLVGTRSGCWNRVATRPWVSTGRSAADGNIQRRAGPRFLPTAIGSPPSARASQRSLTAGSGYRQPPGNVGRVSAYVDESCRERPPGVFVLAAVVVPPVRAPHIRQQLRRHLRPGAARFHWHDEGSERRTFLEELVGLGLPSLVAVAAPIDSRRQERARRKCLERLLWELTELGTREVLLESRQERRDVHDRKAIAAAQQRRSVPADLRYSFGQPDQEPLLWLADAVAGVVSAARAGLPPDGVHLQDLTAVLGPVLPNLAQAARCRWVSWPAVPRPAHPTD